MLIPEKEIVMYLDQHESGVHVNCDETCPLNGKVERYHSHDYDGLLVCGCLEE
jgi:hypothetical protein